MKKVAPVILILSLLSFKLLAQGPVVKTDAGFVKGNTENGIAVFKGIPYAAPPVGTLRFMPSTDHAAWTDTLNTTTFGNIAFQPSGNKADGNEDCLTLNLYTPAADDHKRAVVVWVHGGSMTNGAGKGMNGHAFADKDDIVCITINYRLGSLGFMYLGDVDKRYAQSGNCGLLDVVAALKWIKNNIAAFGGDPDRVTIMGESAGGKMISAVSVSPLAKGLFSQVIAESGSVQCIRDTVTAKNARNKILHQLGLGPNDAAKLLTMSADSIIKAQGVVCAGIAGNSFFGPVYDGVTITQDAYKYAAGTDMPQVKMLIGTNQYEAASFVPANSDFAHAETSIFKPLFGDDAPQPYATYQKELKTSAPYDAAVKVFTQYMYQMHSYRFAKVLANNNIPVWMYRYTFDDGKQYGARHGEELKYIWNAASLSKSDDAAKRQLATDIHGSWVAFIKTGSPNADGLPQWIQYSDKTRQVMFFDSRVQVAGLSEVFDDKRIPSQVFLLK